MEANKLYQQLEKDFIKPGMSDEWWKEINENTAVYNFLTENFKEGSMWLVCDFAEEIKKAFTAVFPSEKVMQEIISRNIKDAMLFLHHPCIWDIRKAPEVFQQMDTDLLQKFSDNKISIYNLHVPLDNYSEYSTSFTLAKEFGDEIYKAFAPYCWGLAWVFSKTDFSYVDALKYKFQQIVGHRVKLYKYWQNEITNNIVAFVAWGWNDVEVLKEIKDAWVNTFVTGVTVKNDFSAAAHEFAQKNGINILWGSHYSTEKFACISMVDYFKKLWLDAEFIEENPLMEDL